MKILLRPRWASQPFSDGDGDPAGSTSNSGFGQITPSVWILDSGQNISRFQTILSNYFNIAERRITIPEDIFSEIRTAVLAPGSGIHLDGFEWAFERLVNSPVDYEFFY